MVGEVEVMERICIGSQLNCCFKHWFWNGTRFFRSYCEPIIATALHCKFSVWVNPYLQGHCAHLHLLEGSCCFSFRMLYEIYQNKSQVIMNQTNPLSSWVGCLTDTHNRHLEFSSSTVNSVFNSIYVESASAHRDPLLPLSVSGPHSPIRPGVFVFAHIVTSYFWSPSPCFLSSLTSHYLCVVCNLIPLTAQLTGEEPTGAAWPPLKLPRNNISLCGFP